MKPGIRSVFVISCLISLLSFFKTSAIQIGRFYLIEVKCCINYGGILPVEAEYFRSAHASTANLITGNCARTVK